MESPWRVLSKSAFNKDSNARCLHHPTVGTCAYSVLEVASETSVAKYHKVGIHCTLSIYTDSRKMIQMNLFKSWNRDAEVERKCRGHVNTEGEVGHGKNGKVAVTYIHYHLWTDAERRRPYSTGSSPPPPRWLERVGRGGMYADLQLIHCVVQ